MPLLNLPVWAIPLDRSHYGLLGVFVRAQSDRLVGNANARGAYWDLHAAERTSKSATVCVCRQLHFATRIGRTILIRPLWGRYKPQCPRALPTSLISAPRRTIDHRVVPILTVGPTVDGRGP